jgi:hypothetical protein
VPGSSSAQRGKAGKAVEFLIIVLVVALIAGCTLWNKRNAALAMEGVEFHVDAPPGVVADAIRSAYCSGAKAMVKSLLSRMTVTPMGADSFHTQSSIGDVGAIEVLGHDGTTTVRAHTTELYVGTPPATQFRSGYFGVAARILHGVYKMLGITPNAAKMRRFHAGVERKVNAALRKAVA